MHLCHRIGSMGTGSIINISTPLIFAFHSKPWEGKVTKRVFTRSTQPPQLQLSPNLVLPSFSGLAGKYRFSCYSRHIIYLIKCVFWHVHYLPAGLTDGGEQTLSFVQTAALFAGGEPHVSPVSAPCPVADAPRPSRWSEKQAQGAGLRNLAGGAMELLPGATNSGTSCGNGFKSPCLCSEVCVYIFIYIHTDTHS